MSRLFKGHNLLAPPPSPPPSRTHTLEYRKESTYINIIITNFFIERLFYNSLARAVPSIDGWELRHNTERTQSVTQSEFLYNLGVTNLYGIFFIKFTKDFPNKIFIRGFPS